MYDAVFSYMVVCFEGNRYRKWMLMQREIDTVIEIARMTRYDISNTSHSFPPA
jgi:hypothetical protein